jgi:two-component system chemotaxis response regulator CheB
LGKNDMATDIKVLVVDDSAFARLAIARELRSASAISVIDSARDGLEAIEKIKALKPDVVTLDVEMPKMDGLATLGRIMAECPTPVVMISSLTGSGTEATIRALELGAVDFFLKNTLANPIGSEGGASDLINKIILASRVKSARQQTFSSLSPVTEKTKAKAVSTVPADYVVVIGSSTGGPKALYQVVPRIPADIEAAVLLVQHMPPGFTNSLANRLNQLSNISVKEACAGDILYQGSAYMARGGYHMVVETGGVISLNQNPPVCNVRPSVDVAMESVARVYGKKVVGVILTGMGSDGTNGSRRIKARGGYVIAEDESTCVVWGMPKSVLESGSTDLVLTLPRIADGIADAVKRLSQGDKGERSRVLLS